MPKSRIRIFPDGREKCTGYQWEKRKKEVRERADGICEGIFVDAKHPVHELIQGDVHHLIPRSKGRDDRLSNLVYICRDLHMAIDKRKVQWSKKVGSQATDGS
jgi:5-methylcytosine-specific restriction endonuclease McrA